MSSHISLLEEVWFIVADARARMRMFMDASNSLSPLRLSLRTYAVLSLSASARGFSQREIGDFLSFDARQVGFLIDELEDLGFIERTQHPDDRRIKVVKSTTTGNQALEAARNLMLAKVAESLVDLSTDEQDTLVQLLSKIRPYGPRFRK